MLSRQLNRPIGWIVAALVLGVGLATAMPQAHGSQPTPLLPDLVADPPDNVSLETSVNEGGLSHTPAQPELLLRFNGYVHNIGPGAVDFQGSREKPEETTQTEEEVESHRENEEELPQTVEEKLAKPPMKAFQRVFTTNAEETNIDRPHKEEPSAAEMVYVNADGHHHFHLQRVARYSLWGAEKGVEVAPAQKVGFCLEDSEHVEPSVGPSSPVYADNVPPYRDFCQQYRPNATSLFEGISPGWRDKYESDLGFQWVDASNVLPGEYWLRADVDPTGVIKEAGGAKAPAYAEHPTIIPGFDAQAQMVNVKSEEARTVTLTSQAWEEKGKALPTPRYTIVSPPTHGTLTAVNGNHVTYTPKVGYSGTDSFTFSAADANSEFPRYPAVATVAIKVGEEPVAAAEVGPQPRTPSVSIEGAPSSMIDGAHAQLSAIANDCSALVWKANAGAITSSGWYTAPPETPAAGIAAVSASCNQSTEAERTITLLGLSRPYATLTGRRLVMTTRVTEAGKVRMSAHLGRRLLGMCAAESRADRTFSCGVTLGRDVPLHARISVVATLQFGHDSLRAVRPTGVVAIVKPTGPSKLGVHARAASLPQPAASRAIAQPGSPVRWPGAVTADQADVAIEGAPSGMIAGTSVQISAIVAGGPPAVTWAAGAGSITAGGLYTAPAVPPAGGRAVVVARGRTGAEDRRTIMILPVPASQAAPAAPLPAEGNSTATPSRSTLGTSASFSPGLARPQAMLIGRKLIMTTRVPAAGRVRLSAYLGERGLGSCVARTSAGRSFTCRLSLGGSVGLDARIGVAASLRSGDRTLTSTRPAARVSQMRMTGPSDLLATADNPSLWQLICSP